MPSQARSGIGTKFYRWSDTSTEWQAIAEVTNISGPAMSRDSIPVTSLDSEDGYEEVIGGLRKGGSVTFGMNFRRETYDMLKADFESDLKQNYKIVIPDTDETTFEFEGLVMELPPKFEVSSPITVDVTIQVSGKVEVYDGSSGA